MNIEALYSRIMNAVENGSLNVVRYHHGMTTQDSITRAVINGDAIDLHVDTVEVVMHNVIDGYVGAVLKNGKLYEGNMWEWGDDPMRAFFECLSQCRAWAKQHGCRGVAMLDEPPRP